MFSTVRFTALGFAIIVMARRANDMTLKNLFVICVLIVLDKRSWRVVGS